MTPLVNSNQAKKTRIGLWLGIVVLIVFLALIAMPGSGPQTRGCQTESASQMQQLGIAASEYKQDHHETYPERLSQLYPKYCSDLDIFYFKCPHGTSYVPPNADSDPRLIDIYSPYGILALADGSAVIFERMPIWPGSVGSCLISRDSHSDADYHRQRLSQPEFANRYLLALKKS